MDVDGVRTVAILTVLWAVAFVVLAFNRERLDDAGIGWLLWTCLAGVGLGLLGLEYTRKRREAIALSRLEEEAEDDDFDHDDASGADDDADVAEEQPSSPGGSTPRAQDDSDADHPQPPDVIPTKPIQRAVTDTRPGLREEPPRNTQTMSALPQSSLPPRQPDSPVLATPPVMATPPLRPGAPHWSGAQLAPTTSPGTTSPGTATPVPSERRSPAHSAPAPDDAPGEGAHQPTPPTGPAAAGPRPPAGSNPAESASPTSPTTPEAGKRRRKQSLGPARPGRVDVGDVSDLAPRVGPPAPGARGNVTQSDFEISPMWSELIDTNSTRQSPISADPDEPLIDETTLGGRRAKRYDMQEDIDEITEGGGGVYRGRRARRRPDSA